ncbi:hypothetical protein [Paenibacillus sp. DMB20]|uniref:hypothetical protein n=1 Tax=Paenibacillus sp. DMB20 TaxID=1642570 RepID=UPI000AB5E2F8|nr:hypothetical protein [Paenibacillus sp. DMB20]
MAVIIYPKTMNWSYMKQRPQQLMTQLGALGHQVYFENLAPLDREFREVEKKRVRVHGYQNISLP